MRDYHKLYTMNMLHSFATPLLFTGHDTNLIDCITQRFLERLSLMNS